MISLLVVFYICVKVQKLLFVLTLFLLLFHVSLSLSDGAVHSVSE